MNILNKAAPMGQNAGIGGWNDLDNLEVGVGNLTDDEEKAHFSMWAMVKSPLIIGADVNHLKESSYSIYSQASVIAINQDPKGVPATRVWRHYVSQTDKYGKGEIQLWSCPLDNGDQVIALLNGSNKKRPMNASLEDIFFDSYLGSEELSSSWDISVSYTHLDVYKRQYKLQLQLLMEKLWYILGLYCLQHFRHDLNVLSYSDQTHFSDEYWHSEKANGEIQAKMIMVIQNIYIKYIYIYISLANCISFLKRPYFFL